MSVNEASESLNGISPKAIERSFSFPECSDCRSEYFEVLSTMLNEQSEHLYGKFNESYLKYRGVVMAWMIDVCEYFHLHITTSHMAIAYLDRLQPNEKFGRFEWQIIAIACIIIAAKYNEMEEHVPGLKRIEEITQQEIPNETFLYYELWTLKKMGWKLNARVPSCFLTTQFELGVCSSEQDLVTSRSTSFYSPRQNKKVKLSSEDISELQSKMYELSTKCILDIRFKSIQASAIATAILYYVRRVQHVSPVWSDRLTSLTFHDPKTSQSVMKALHLILELEKPSSENDPVTVGQSRLFAPSDLLDEEDEEDTLEGEDTLTSEDVDRLDLDECDEEEEEETDLVQALHKALFMDQATPSKGTAADVTAKSSLITPVVPQKTLVKGMLESDLSPVAITDFVSP